MNKTSIDKIRTAAPFLLWFRQHLPQPLQAKIQPYLDRPYQLALKVIDCCHSDEPLTVVEIAQLAGVAQETARQVLHCLKEGGMPFAASPSRGWQVDETEGGFAPPLLPLNSHHESQDSSTRYTAAVRE